MTRRKTNLIFQAASREVNDILIFGVAKAMKRRAAIVLVCLVVVPLLYAFYIASSLIALILEDGLDDAVSLADIEAHGNVSDALHPIPKIIHQTWKNEHVPEHWQIAQFTWYAFSFNGAQG